jgi:hypothetical protein
MIKFLKSIFTKAQTLNFNNFVLLDVNQTFDSADFSSILNAPTTLVGVFQLQSNRVPGGNKIEQVLISATGLAYTRFYDGSTQTWDGWVEISGGGGGGGLTNLPVSNSDGSVVVPATSMQVLGATVTANGSQAVVSINTNGVKSTVSNIIPPTSGYVGAQGDFWLNTVTGLFYTLSTPLTANPLIWTIINPTQPASYPAITSTTLTVTGSGTASQEIEVPSGKTLVVPATAQSNKYVSNIDASGTQQFANLPSSGYPNLTSATLTVTGSGTANQDIEVPTGKSLLVPSTIQAGKVVQYIDNTGTQQFITINSTLVVTTDPDSTISGNQGDARLNTTNGRLWIQTTVAPTYTWVNVNADTTGITNITSADNTVVITGSSSTKDLSITGKAVLAITTNGTNPLTNTIDIVGTGNTTVTRNGNQIIINSTGGGGGYASSFSTNTTSGVVPLVVNCTDTTANTSGQTPTGWAWSVIGGQASDYSISSATAQNPTVTFNASSAGNTYQIRLLASGSVTFTPALVTITPQAAQVVNGDFGVVQSFANPSGTVSKAHFDWSAGDLIAVTATKTNAQTCASVTSATIAVTGSTLIPTITLTAANINNGDVVNSSALTQQPTQATTYTTTVVAVMNNSDSSTTSKTHSTSAINYYVPALYIQNNSGTAYVFTKSDTKVATLDYVAGQSFNLNSLTNNWIWVAVPLNVTTLNCYVQAFPGTYGVITPNVVAPQITISGVTYSVFGYNLGTITSLVPIYVGSAPSL